MLRVLLQMGAAGAMLSQREGLALVIGRVAMLLEMIQDRYTGGRGASVATGSAGPRTASAVPPVEPGSTKIFAGGV
jgi:hypothetical protein